MLRDITVSCAPHISKKMSTRSVMIDVIIAMVPAIVMALVYFRINAAILITTCVVSAVVTEWLCNKIAGKPNSLGDFSAVVTGIILALSLSSALPFWAAIIGSCFCIAIGKMVFGGLGANIFNPAMVGRTFLAASFGMLMTTWAVPATIDSSMPNISADNTMDSVTQATPLSWSKQVIKGKVAAIKANSMVKSALLGQTGGCLGETSAIALLLGGIYLLIRKTISFHIPAAVLLSVSLFASICYFTNPERFVIPSLHLVGGGMMLCAFFIATDPVTAPLTKRGMWIFGIGVGTLTMLIRVIGEYPGGVMYAILLMNAVTPLINILCKKIPAGGKPSA